MTEKGEMTGSQKTGNKKHSRRFRPTHYLEKYLPSASNEYKLHAQDDYGIIEGYHKHGNKAYWSHCCRCFITKKMDLEYLGHPSDRLMSIKDFIRLHGIHS